MPVHRGRRGAYTIRSRRRGRRSAPARSPPLLLHGPGLQYFHSRHDLHPATLTASAAHGPTAPGDLFVGLFSAPFQLGPGQPGARDLRHERAADLVPPDAPTGRSRSTCASQQYQGKPVLTWWQGYVTRASAAARAGSSTPPTARSRPCGRQRLRRRSARVQAHAAGHRADRRRTTRSSATSPPSAAQARRRARRGRAGDRHRDRLVLCEWHSLDHVALERLVQPAPTVAAIRTTTSTSTRST